MLPNFYGELEQRLLFHPEFIYSDEQLSAFESELLQIKITDPTLKHYKDYLIGILACCREDYQTALQHFHMINHSYLPTESQAFFTIYHAIAHCIFEPMQIPQRLSELRTLLAPDKFSYLLAQLVIITHNYASEQARSFYLNLQLLELLPSLEHTALTIQTYYEIACFYLFRSQNIPLAQLFFEKTLSFSQNKSSDFVTPLTKMCWINLAYCAYFNRDETLAYTYYEQLLAHPYRNDIDELYYIRALNNAYSMSIANQNDIFITEIQDTFTSITTTDLAKRRSLRFTELYIEIQTLLQAETIDLQKLAPLKCEIEALLPLIEMRLAASRPDIMWIVLHGQICLKQGNISEGIQYFHQSLTLCETYQQHYSRSLTHDILSSVYEEQADFSSALIHAKASADIKSRSFHEHNHYYLTSLISEFDNKNLEIQIISNRSEKEQLESLVVQDQLTKLHNRHYLQQFMDKLPTSLPVQIAMIDIDFFKKYNDFYGHLKGDQLLINFASLLATCLSDYEVIRYGGEEFLVVGHAHSQQLFIRALRDFQVQLNHRHYTHHGINDTAIVSASIGYSYVSGGTHTDQILFTQLINQADQALYAAKAAGRNQCFAFENINC